MNNCNRSMSEMEAMYARSAYLKEVFVKWFILSAGIITIVLGILLVTLLGFELQGFPGTSGVYFILLEIGIFVIGFVCVAFGIWREPQLRNNKSQLCGTLVEKKDIQVRPNSAVSKTIYLYFIDDTKLYWPPGTEDIYKPLVGQHIELSVVMIDNKIKPKLTKILRRIGCAKFLQKYVELAVVLNLRDAIDVHRDLEKYGRGYFLR